ncbi:MAG: metallophosphoesterase [Bacteroides sp.]|nr:metallophosphoesterase [Bacteroides sp.]MCM1548784.1 metallophosphoesterase [Clostridium sp.]
MKRENQTKEKEQRSGTGIRKKMLIMAGVFFVLLVSCDMRLKTVVYTMETEKLNRPIRLALITDLHSCKYGKNQSTLLQAVDAQKPDIVLLGGDIFDDERSYENAEITLKYLSEQYPCYYVTGNHEYWSRDIATILEIVDSYGITILEGACDTIQVKGQTLNICGVDDPDVVSYTKNAKGMTEQLMAVQAQKAEAGYSILLTHRPEWVDTYKQYGFDLILAGHAHGGQWRIPGLLNGLYAPNQGIFPAYAGGKYPLEPGTMIVSRGLARESTLAPRIFNRPELVIIDLQ